MSAEEVININACQSMDRDAQRRIYEGTIDRVYNLVLRMLSNESDAFDLTQEVYVRVFTSIGSFRGESSLETWIHRIAVNEVLAFRRRRASEKKHLQALGGRQEGGNGTFPQTPDFVCINEALERLSDKDRLILLLRYDQGLDYRSIAELLECAEGTVASRLDRAKQRLRKMFAGSVNAGEETHPSAHPMKEQVRRRIPEIDAGNEPQSAARGNHRRPGNGI